MTPPTIPEDENDEKSAKPPDGTSRSRRTPPDDRAGNEPADRVTGGAEPPQPNDHLHYAASRRLSVAHRTGTLG